jgi:hypothetical protein
MNNITEFSFNLETALRLHGCYQDWTPYGITRYYIAKFSVFRILFFFFRLCKAIRCGNTRA